MDWIYDKPPKLYEEVIVCSDEGKRKSAIYLGNGKWSTFLNIVCWQHFPDAPDSLVQTIPEKEAPKKKRGRPKKNG